MSAAITPTTAEPILLWIEPQKPSEPISYPGCVTISWLIGQPFVSTALEEAWDRTAKSGEENGVFAVYDPKNNTVHVGVASQGRHIPDGHGGSMPAMPSFGADYTKFINELGVPVSYITDAHSHPDHYPNPSGFDVQALDGLGGPDAVGLIITDRGKYSPYSIVGKLQYPQTYLDKCRTPNVSQPSIHVRFN